MSVHRLAAWLSSTVVLAAVLAGFMISGAPVEQRLKRLDDQRVNDLRQLAAALDSHWASHGSLPEALPGLVDGRLLSQLPTDPGSGALYAYQRVDERDYRLCAEFARASEAWDRDSFWNHPAGLHCFGFTVSPQGRPALR